MKTTHTHPVSVRAGVALLALIAFLLPLGANGLAMAQEPDYTLDWWTVDGGGAAFNEGDGYALGSTAGQPDAGVLGDGKYTLVGGFWVSGAVSHRIYLPLVLRNA